MRKISIYIYSVLDFLILRGRNAVLCRYKEPGISYHRKNMSIHPERILYKPFFMSGYRLSNTFHRSALDITLRVHGGKLLT